jgi:hypothetical protein
MQEIRFFIELIPEKLVTVNTVFYFVQELNSALQKLCKPSIQKPFTIGGNHIPPYFQIIMLV